VNFQIKEKLLLILLLIAAFVEAQDSVRLNTQVTQIAEPSIIVAPSSISKKDKCSVCIAFYGRNLVQVHEGLF
jgi:hypothetical protein